MKRLWSWSFVVGMALAVGVIMASGYRRNAQMSAVVEEQRQKKRELAALREEHARLVAAQASLDEQSRTRDARRALPELRSRVMALNAKLRELDQPAEKQNESTPCAEWSAAEWKNVGRATPVATTETALWAAVGGDIDVLAQTLVLDERGRTAAERLLAGLPETSRRAYVTPERLIALLAAKAVPAGAITARVSDVVEMNQNETQLRVRLQDATGASESARLRLQRGTDGWRVVVTERAVGKYAEALRGAEEKGGAATSPH
jgi:hypothetical protein